MRQQAGFVTLLLILFTSTLFANHVDLYINSYKDIAQREMKRSGIPASIIIAQGIHESSWGRGTLAKDSKNHFGIKCKDYWTGPTYYYKDDDYVDGELVKSCFRVYDNVESSYIDHTDFLVDNPRYVSLFNYEVTDYKNWAIGLKKCGYATDPKYAEKLIRIIETHQLQRFDTMIEVFVMEAPQFFIPDQYLKKEQAVDPVMYTYEETIMPSPIVVYEETEEENNFDYEVPYEEIVIREEELTITEEEVIVYADPEKEIDLSAYDDYEYEPTEIIPNNSSRDKRIKNLTRKPRTSAVGPR